MNHPKMKLKKNNSTFNIAKNKEENLKSLQTWENVCNIQRATISIKTDFSRERSSHKDLMTILKGTQ